jgi:hypothetical protein
MATTRLSKTFSSAGNRRTFTLSAWIKRSKIGSAQTFGLYKQEGGGGGNNYLYVGYFNSSDKLYLARNQSATEVEVITNRLFRDTNSWYHIVIAIDTTQGTASDRVKCWVNGVQETSFATATYPSQNQQFDFNVAQTHYLGSTFNGTSDNFDGIISHMHFCDGYSYQASDFGSTDSTTGEWKIKTNVSVSYGTNGFFFFKDGTNLSGSTVQDQSGQGNNWTVAGGTLTKTEDNPSNVFATMNPLNVPTSNAPTFSNGNTTTVSSSNGSAKWGGSSTLGMTSGKFYIEAKATVGSPSRSVIGITGDATNMARGNGSPYGSDQNSSGWYSDNGQVNWNNSAQYTASTYTTGDIVQIAIDLDNNRLFYGKNNTWQNSGDPTSSTGAITIASASDCNDGAYFICQADDTGTSVVSKFEFNFGNGYFGTTAVSSAGTNASGNGIFEYDVPTGYTALSTKGLNL